ncbi:MAG TPA: alpha/beta family hydrolase [Candidatus Dormibacteraeota bacterium]
MKILLGPGASKGAEGMRPYVAGLRERGFDAEAIELPRGDAQRAVPVFRRVAEGQPTLAAGGHSFGGRVASLVAAEGFEFAGLLLFSYPLHPPGKPDAWDARTEHWPRITCPVLLLSGDRDQFARLDLLRQAALRLPRHELHVIAGAGHGFRGELNAALDIASGWLGRLTT